ncbi:MAG: hypothetical protein WEB29_04540 [Chloroflexota bacterium]
MNPDLERRGDAIVDAILDAIEREPEELRAPMLAALKRPDGRGDR